MMNCHSVFRTEGEEGKAEWQPRSGATQLEKHPQKEVFPQSNQLTENGADATKHS